jgi:orotidine-5'-phosphate decarboxylase
MTENRDLLKAKRGVIIAADVTSLDHLRQLLEISAELPEVVAIKVGFSLALRYGLPPVVKMIKEESHLPVIYDHQKAGTDIPAMGRAFAESCCEAGVHGVIFFPMAGPETLGAFVSASTDYGQVPIVGLVMTHPAYFISEGGFIDDNAPSKIGKLSVKAGVRHFVLPGNKPDVVREFCQTVLEPARPASIMMPGIGSQGGSVARAFAAVSGHRPFAIIGSAVYRAPDPKTALKQFVAEVRG